MTDERIAEAEIREILDRHFHKDRAADLRLFPSLRSGIICYPHIVGGTFPLW